MEAYRKLYDFFLKLNASDDVERDSIITEYDHVGIDLEPEFQSYSYLFIVSLKSLVDIFACVLDIVQNHTPRKEEDAPDFFNYLRIKNNRSDKKEFLVPNKIKAVNDELDRLRDKNNKSWLHQVKEIRDCIVHRGYLLRPEGNFKKQDKLIIVLDKGSNFNNLPGQKFDIGMLFDDFMSQMHLIDCNVSDILVSNLKDLALYKNAKARYRYVGFASELTFDLN